MGISHITYIGALWYLLHFFLQDKYVDIAWYIRVWNYIDEKWVFPKLTLFGYVHTPQKALLLDVH